MCRFILSALLVILFLTAPVDGAKKRVKKKDCVDSSVLKVVQANTDFAFNLHRQFAKENKDKNVCFSPYSISTVLAMMWEGANKNTGAEMADVLRFTDLIPQDIKIHTAFGKLNRNYNRPGKPYQLYTVNALWVDDSFPLLRKYEKVLTKMYDTPYFPADFVDDAEAERKRINDWVKGQSNNRIKELLPKGSIAEDTRIVLTNVTYFNAKWAKPFTKEATTKEIFTLLNTRKVKTPFMFQHTHFEYTHLSKEGTAIDLERLGKKKPPEGAFQLIELPYRGKKNWDLSDLSMIVILPDQLNGLAALEKKLSAKNVNGWMKQMNHKVVDLTLPKFKFETEYNLRSTLTALGMKDAFNPAAADFTRMSNARNVEKLYITSAFHKTFVKVDEEGTEAAAASAGGGGFGGIPKVIPKFKADHPFLFLIRENKTGSILFLGRVMNPQG